jgi:hypothetical protein
MFSVCANPECQAPFDYQHGRLFRFHKDATPDENPPNTHCVQHFWLCCRCLNIYTLEYQSKRDVVRRNFLGISANLETIRFIAAA